MAERGDILCPLDRASLAETLRAGPALPIGRGSRSGWGAPVAAGTRLVSLRAFASFTRLDAEDLSCGVEPGIGFATFLDALRDEGLAFEPGPFAEPEARSLGGVLGEGAPSARGHDRGSLRSQVLGIRALDGEGMAFGAGGRVIKNVAGYDLCKLFCGGGGAYGALTELQLRVVRRPARCSLLARRGVERAEAARLWLAARDALPEARSVDLCLGAGGAAVEALVTRRLGACPGALAVDAEGPELWDLPPAVPATGVLLRGRLRPSRVAALLAALPADATGRVHARGAFELGAASFTGLAFPEGSVVRAIRGEAPCTTELEPATARRAAEVARCLGAGLAPGRIAFDTAEPAA